MLRIVVSKTVESITASFFKKKVAQLKSVQAEFLNLETPKQILFLNLAPLLLSWEEEQDKIAINEQKFFSFLSIFV